MSLTKTDTIESGDLLLFWKTRDGDYRGISLDDAVAIFQARLSVPGAYITKYASPAATGFSVTVDTVSDDVHLILQPTGSFAAGTIVLPPVAGLVDGQKVLVNCTQAVTTLTVGANGATAVTGAPTTLAQNGFFTMKFDLVSKSWYRVG